MANKMTPQDKLRALENDWLAAERAVLEHPEYPPCMLATARKAVERLEKSHCQNRENSTSPFRVSLLLAAASAGSSTEPREG